LALWKCSTWHPKIQRLILKSAALGAHKLKYFKSIGVDTGAALFGRQTLHFLIDKHRLYSADTEIAFVYNAF